MHLDRQPLRAGPRQIARAMLAVAERHHAHMRDAEPACNPRRAALRDRHVGHLRHAFVFRIEKFADPAHLADMPVVDGLEHVVGVVAVGAQQQLVQIDDHHFVARAVGREDAFEAHMIVAGVIGQGHDPVRSARGLQRFRQR
ncbi:hypothetical protein PT2222_160216 [Paraburkholderia tropica]